MLSSFYKKNIKPLKNSLGKVVDTGSDFLPPGFRDVGNFAGKRLQGQSTKDAIIGSAKDYAMGRISKGIGGKVKNTLGMGGDKFGLEAANRAGDAATRSVMDSTGNVGRSSAVDKIMGAFRGERGRAVKNTLSGAIRDKLLGGKPITIGSVAGRAGDLARNGAGWVGNNPLEAAGYGAAGLAGLEAKKRYDAAGKLRKQALDVKTKSYAEREGLRRQGVAGMMNTVKAVPIDELTDSTNNFARKRRVV